MSYHYIQTEPGLWTVGTGSQKDKTWEPESDHTSPQAAANRVIVLNGGTLPSPPGGSAADALAESVSELIELLNDGRLADAVRRANEQEGNDPSGNFYFLALGMGARIDDTLKALAAYRASKKI